MDWIGYVLLLLLTLLTVLPVIAMIVYVLLDEYKKGKKKAAFKRELLRFQTEKGLLENLTPEDQAWYYEQRKMWSE